MGDGPDVGTFVLTWNDGAERRPGGAGGKVVTAIEIDLRNGGRWRVAYVGRDLEPVCVADLPDTGDGDRKFYRLMVEPQFVPGDRLVLFESAPTARGWRLPVGMQAGAVRVLAGAQARVVLQGAGGAPRSLDRRAYLAEVAAEVQRQERR